MSLIVQAKTVLTPRERLRRIFEFQRPDRVSIGYESNPGAHARLCRALGIAPEDHETLLRTLGVDYRGVSAPYIGPPLFPEPPPGLRVDPLKGSLLRWVPHQSGGYWEYCVFPLKDAEDEAFENYPIPNPDHFDYDQALAQATANEGYAHYVGGAGTPDIINHNGRIMGMEDTLVNLATGREAALAFMRRKADSQLKVLERTLDKCRGLIDFVWLGEDLGTQIGPMISLSLYRDFFKPIHKSFVDLAAAYGLPAIIHTCGSSSWAYEDFIEIGMRGVDTLQPEAANMSPAYLKAHFGGRLNFRGCISTAGPLAYGTPEEVTRVCRDTLACLMDTNGYHFAPTHMIQDNTPVENILAMYNAVHQYGVY